MLRLLTLIFSTLLVALPLTGSAASAAPAPTAVHASQSGGDDAGDDAADADDASTDPADDPADEPVDLSELCALAGDDSADDTAGEDASDDEDGAISIDLGVLDSLDGDDDPEDVPDPPDDPGDGIDCSGADEAGGTLAGGGTHTVSVADILKSGVVSTGTVKMSGPGVITQELWLPAAAPAARHGLRAATGKGAGRSAKGKARKATGRTLGGRVVKTVTRAGTVTLKVRLNAAARRLLRRTKKDVRITVKTTTRVRGGKAQVRNGTLVARRKAAKK